MYEVLTKQYLEDTKEDGYIIKGVCLLREVNKCTSRNGKPYYGGMLTAGADVPIRVWSDSSAFKALEDGGMAGSVVNMRGCWNHYNGSWSIVVDFLSKADGYSPMDFIDSPYDIPAYWEQLQELAKQNLSEKGYAYVRRILFDNEEVAERFKTELAAKGHHDNVKGGLLAHTYKVARLAVFATKMYEGVCDSDLLIIGSILHDIGKVREMCAGVYQPEAIVCHNFLGVEMLDRDYAVMQFGEEWYYQLVSVLLEHHGEWGMRPKTVLSYMVFQLDCLDARLTELRQKVQSASETICMEEKYHLKR